MNSSSISTNLSGLSIGRSTATLHTFFNTFSQYDNFIGKTSSDLVKIIKNISKLNTSIQEATNSITKIKGIPILSLADTNITSDHILDNQKSDTLENYSSNDNILINTEKSNLLHQNTSTFPIPESSPENNNKKLGKLGITEADPLPTHHPYPYIKNNSNAQKNLPNNESDGSQGISVHSALSKHNTKKGNSNIVNKIQILKNAANKAIVYQKITRDSGPPDTNLSWRLPQRVITNSFITRSVNSKKYINEPITSSQIEADHASNYLSFQNSPVRVIVNEVNDDLRNSLNTSIVSKAFIKSKQNNTGPLKNYRQMIVKKHADIAHIDPEKLSYLSALQGAIQTLQLPHYASELPRQNMLNSKDNIYNYTINVNTPTNTTSNVSALTYQVMKKINLDIHNHLRPN